VDFGYGFASRDHCGAQTPPALDYRLANRERMAEDSKQDDVPDDRRNALIGMGVVLLLVVAGWLLVHWIRDTSRVQDCVMSGRTNCAPIQATAPDR
jgi:type II secretory pathway component PulM